MGLVHRPLFHLLISFCGGIFIGRYLSPVPVIFCFILTAFFSALLFFFLVQGRKSSFLPLLVFVLSGTLASSTIPDPDQPPGAIQQLLKKKNVVLTGTITHSLQRGPTSSRMLLNLASFKEGDGWRSVSGNLLLNIRNCQRQWPVGQTLAGRVRIRPVRNFNNPGAFNYRQYLAHQKIWLRGYVQSDMHLVPLDRPERNFNYFLDVLRNRIRTFIDRWLPPSLAGLYRSLLLGERYALSADLRELLYNAGIGHLLAISGLHLGLVAAFAFLLCHFVSLRITAVAARWGARPVAALTAFPIALVYGLLTGMALPALRATLMLAVFTLSLVVQREKDLQNSLLLAALIILAIYPEALFAASFQLSFIGVAALILILPLVPLPRRLLPQDDKSDKFRHLGLRLYQFICGSLMIFLYTTPLVLYHFHRFTALGILSNLLAVPVVAFLVLPAGLLAVFLLPLSSSLAGFFLTLGSLGLSLVVTLSAKLASLTWATFWPGSPRIWQVLLAYLLLLLSFVKTNRRCRFSLMVVCSLFLMGSWVIPLHFPSGKSLLRVTFLDVSQGNSAVVELPGNRIMLIDGGGFHGSSFDLGRYVLAPYLWHRRITRLHTMVLSHPHPDHYQGLTFVAKHFPIKQFWHSNVCSRDPSIRGLLTTLAAKKVAFMGPRELVSNQNINGVDLKVLHPSPDFTGSSRTLTDKEINNLSLVVRLKYKDVSFLFPGDIEKETEDKLARGPHLHPVDVLLVPHHGSRTSSSIPFLQRLKPRIAIFSLGFDNRFHLPAFKVLERYDALGIKTYRTDRHGAVTVITDGHKIEVETFINQEKSLFGG
ncbi:MAG: DNA internalization-related competence protein ComEC/Rec2 [Deltaproteobacteria bacterium]|nr:DNA internalization-related competence protein ComEC/Rec2 [Deltaproteobacteria bacterium]